MADAKVVGGYLVPHPDDIREVLKRLRLDIQRDPQIAEAYRSNPRQVLGMRGLNHDIQTEWLDEDDLQAGCITTCVCTGCCITN